MRLFQLIFFAAMTGLLSGPASAAPLLDCKKADTFPAACAAKAIVTLDRSVGAAFDTAIATAADPLTATLLRQENTRRALILASIAEINDEQIPTMDFLRKSLSRDKGLLEAIRAPVPDGPAGDWLNAFAGVHISPLPGGGYHMTVDRSWIEDRRGEAASGRCTVAVDLAPAANGWFAVDGKADDPTLSKVVRQGPALRLVLGTKRAQELDCGQHDSITGTYFRAASADHPIRYTPVYAAEKPSFDCKGANGEIEMDICSDPDMARQDRVLAAAYKGALGRVDGETGKFLKTDQAAWIKQRQDLYDDALLPTAAKSSLPPDDFGAARSLLLNVTKGRIAMLQAIEGQRSGFIGDWMSTDSYARVRKTASGELKLQGTKIYLFYHDGECSYGATPTVAKGLLVAPATDETEDDVTGRDTPSVWSDGNTLLIDADLEAKQRELATNKSGEGSYRPHYCERNRKPTARLFPIREEIKLPFGNESTNVRLVDGD